jgi:hypothetical protein
MNNLLDSFLGVVLLVGFCFAVFMLYFLILRIIISMIEQPLEKRQELFSDIWDNSEDDRWDKKEITGGEDE